MDKQSQQVSLEDLGLQHPFEVGIAPAPKEEYVEPQNAEEFLRLGGKEFPLVYNNRK